MLLLLQTWSIFKLFLSISALSGSGEEHSVHAEDWEMWWCKKNQTKSKIPNQTQTEVKPSLLAACCERVSELHFSGFAAGEGGAACLYRVSWGVWGSFPSPWFCAPEGWFCWSCLFSGTDKLWKGKALWSPNLSASLLSHPSLRRLFQARC